MNPTAAGRLSVGVGYRNGRIESIESRLQRPAAHLSQLLAGQAPQQALALVGMLFSLCGRAHAVAGARALDAARGVQQDQQTEHWRDALVRVERIRETGLRLLRDWHYPDGSEDRLHALLKSTQTLIRQLEQTPGVQAAAPEAAPAAVQAWWGRVKRPAPAESYWISERARHWRGVQLGHSVTTLDPALSQALDSALSCDVDDRFVAAPALEGNCCQTGPVTAAGGVQDGAGVISTTLRALVDQLDRDVSALDAMAVPAKSGFQQRCGDAGYGWALTARGWLLHRVVLDGEAIKQWQILAPTDWNFHTEGALRQRLEGVEIERERLGDLVRDLVLSHDPCVGYGIRINDA